MKSTLAFFLIGFVVVPLSCQRSDVPKDDPDPIFSASFFNQINTAFSTSQVSCLLSQSEGNTYPNEPIVFRVINDASTYTAFFSCKSTTPLPAIDFAKSSLLIGMKSDYNQSIKTPINVTNINQTLTPVSNGNYALQVNVLGQSGLSLQKGGEWFAFASVVPKITGTVKLDMQYQFK